MSNVTNSNVNATATYLCVHPSHLWSCGLEAPPPADDRPVGAPRHPTKTRYAPFTIPPKTVTLISKSTG
ncbi:hypothetical protein JYU34_000032 [Plutella xylostella]|uniref:Uncharacterized protein n=1 Tax=Plutella xylostella TaxID=51655 RepID=A0ABQ7R6M8_PLUXY|nr:hypothetical protein JYU34_000032 [Plutella xylostella]